MKLLMISLVLFGLLSMTVFGFAEFSDPCYNSSGTYDEDTAVVSGLTIYDNCEYGNYVQWTGDVNLSILGNVTDNEVLIGDSWVFVNSVLRPDLDANALVVFERSPFAILPGVLKDGNSCLAPSCNATLSGGKLYLVVDGFSNYSLQGRQDFTVYSDTEPELKDKVYQTIDLGDSHRSEQFSCITQIFGRNQLGQFVLVQTNPERKIQAKLWGSPDTNQPESLGYFPTNGGLANVYFRNFNIVGMSDFEYVAQCTSNSTSLVYEESISTRYSPAGRVLVGRSTWFTSGDNAFYVSVYVIGGLIILWVVLVVLRRTFK